MEATWGHVTVADRARAWGSGARDRLRAEHGFALPLALSVILVLTVVVLGVVKFSAASARGADLSESRQEAKAVAEGGFNAAAAIVAAAPTTAALPDCTTWSGWTTVATGEQVRWCGTYDTITQTWTVKGQGRVANPTGPGAGAQTHIVEAKLELTEDVGAWNFVYVKPDDDCVKFSNSFVIESPLYVDGDLCLENSARYAGPRLYVKGKVKLTNSAGVGTEDAKIPAVSVKDNSPALSGCAQDDDLFVLPCTGPDHNVWSESFDTNVPDVDKPAIDLAAQYAAAAPGSTARNHRCYAASKDDLLKVNSKIGEFWSTSFAGNGWAGASNRLDNDTTRQTDDAGLGVVDLMPKDVSYDCRFYDASGSLHGRVAWTYGDPGTLTVEGIVFFDADIKIAKTDGVVNGEGVIYANNKIVLENLVTLCGVADCGPSWSPDMEPPHLLFLIGGHSGNWAVEVQNSAKFQGAVYANGGMTIGNHAMVHGPVLANELQAHNNSDFNPWPWMTSLPEGVPSAGNTGLRLKPGSWRG